MTGMVIVCVFSFSGYNGKLCGVKNLNYKCTWFTRKVRFFVVVAQSMNDSHEHATCCDVRRRRYTSH